MTPHTAHRNGQPIHAGPEVVVEQFGHAPHWCRLPRGWRRRRLGLQPGAVVRCLHCSQRWQLTDSHLWHRLPPPPTPTPPTGGHGTSRPSTAWTESL